MKTKLIIIFFLITITLYASTPIINSINPKSGFNDNKVDLQINGKWFDTTCKLYSNVETPFIEFNIKTDRAYGVYVSSNYAYVADGNSGLRIIDLTTQKVISSIATPNTAYNVYVTNGYAYVACGESGLQIIDIVSKTIVGSISTSGTAYSVYVSGNSAYVADGESGLQIIDIVSKTIIGRIATPGSAYSVQVSGNHAYISDGESGLQIIDIVNRKIVGNIDTPGTARNIYVTDKYAYIADGDSGVQIIDITDINKLFIYKTILTPTWAYSVSASNDYIYIGDELTVRIIDINSFNLMWIIDTQNVAYNIFPSNDSVYISNLSNGLNAIKTINPEIINVIKTQAIAYDVYVSGDKAYVADGDAGLQIIDIASKAIVGSVLTGGTAYGVYVSGNNAYVASGEAGLQIIDITNKAIVGSVLTGGTAYSVYVSGNNAYVASGEAGLQIIDIASKTIVGSVATSGTAYSVYVYGDKAYVADGEAGLQIIDITNKTIVGSVATGGEAYSVYVSGNNAYVASGEAGLQIIDIASKTIVDSVATSGMAYDVHVSDSLAYVANYDNKLQIIDLSNNKIINNIKVASFANNVFINENYVYLADDIAGLYIMHKQSLCKKIDPINIINDSTLFTYTPINLIPNKYRIEVVNSNGEKSDYSNFTILNSKANFYSNTTYIYIPATINFFDSSQGQSDSWLWDFGDGQKSIDKNPSHTYDLSGIYSVSLNIKGLGSFDSTEKINYIRAYNPPTISNTNVYPSSGNVNTKFTYYMKYTDEYNNSPTNGYPKIAIDENSLSMVEDAPFDKNYSDGKTYKYETTGLIKNINHTFKFISPNAVGDTTLFYSPIVNNSIPIVTNLEINPTLAFTTADLIASYIYTDADYDMENGTEIKWYKNGVVQEALNNFLIVPNENTKKGEIWYFTVNPKDDEDFGDKKTSNGVLIQNSKPELSVTSPLDGSVYNQNALIVFSSEVLDADNDLIKYFWKSDKDGIFGYNKNVSINTLTNGNHQIILEADDGDVAVYSTTQIRINGLPNVNLECVPSEGKIPVKINFNASASDDINIEKYYWDFNGDNIVDRETLYNTTSFLYNNAGQFKTVVKVEDSDKVEASASQNISAIESSLPYPNSIKSLISDTTNISVSSENAYDSTPPVYYMIEGEFFDGSSWNKTQGVSNYEFSDYIPNNWKDDNLIKNGLYRYRQIVKDSVVFPNFDTSNWYEINTLISPPQDNDITFINVTKDSMSLAITSLDKPSGVGNTGVYLDMVLGGNNDINWADYYSVEFTGLLSNTQYGWKIKYRNYKGIETNFNNSIQKKYTLAMPIENLEITNVTDNSISLKWDKKGASRIKLERSYNSTELYTTLDSTLDSTFYNDTDLTSGTTYYYRARAYNGDGIITEPSNIVKTTTIPAYISNFHHTNNTLNSITWEWDDANGELGYQLHNGTDSTLGTVSSDITYITEINLSANTLISNRHIHAYNESGLSESSSQKQVYTSIETPEITFDEITTNSIKLFSNNLSNILSGNSGVNFNNITNFNLSGWQRNTSWTSSNLAANTRYIFKAQARNGDLDTTQFSEMEYKYTLCNSPPNLINNLRSSSLISISWDKNEATRYAVERLNESSTWETIINWDSGLEVSNYNDIQIEHGKNYWYRIRAYNGDKVITDSGNEISVLANTAPLVKNLVINPFSPNTNEDLIGSYEYSDIDGDQNIGTEIKWYKNKILQVQFNDNLTIPSSATQKGEEWYFTVFPKDGLEFSEIKASAFIVIQNAKPVAKNLLLSPSLPNTNENLVGSYEYSDIDEDPNSGSQIKWYKNGILESQFNNSLTIPFSATQKGEEWYFTVFPKDGDVFGEIKSSSSVSIQNTKPTAKKLELTPLLPSTNEDLVGTYEFSDIDGDLNSGTEIKWYKNGILESQYNNSLTILFSATQKGEVWYFTILPKDGTEFGEEKISNAVLIQNSQPSVTLECLPESGKAPLIVKIKSSAITDIGIEKYYWDFNGDNSFDRITLYDTTSFNYEVPGIYKIISKVLDKEGSIGENFKFVNINAKTYTHEEAAYQYIYSMMDKFDTGTTLRLIADYDTSKIASTDNNALAMLAMISRGTNEDYKRAKIIAKAFIYGIDHDNRLRNSYKADNFINIDSTTASLDGNENSYSEQSAWAIIALLKYQEYETTNLIYLSSAKKIGEWINQNCLDTKTYIGYTHGIEINGTEQIYDTRKFTDENIVIYSAFVQLYSFTKELIWLERAGYAKKFIESMWTTANMALAYYQSNQVNKYNFYINELERSQTTGILSTGITANYLLVKRKYNPLYFEQENIIALSPLNFYPYINKIIVGDTYLISVSGGMKPYSWSINNPSIVNLEITNDSTISISSKLNQILIHDKIFNISLSDEFGNIITTEDLILQFDNDNDKLPDTWEVINNLDPHKASANNFWFSDSDNDGISNGIEWEYGFNPQNANSPYPPQSPSINNVSPSNDRGEIILNKPFISVNNAVYDTANAFYKQNIRYAFNVYADENLNQIYDSAREVLEGQNTTIWQVNKPLTENTQYWWTSWAYIKNIKSNKTSKSTFFININNEPPQKVELNYPVDNSEILDKNIKLEVKNTHDFDKDIKTYEFEINKMNGSLVSNITNVIEGDQGVTSITINLDDNTWYVWRSRAMDEHNLSGEWMNEATFFVNSNNTYPLIPQINYPLDSNEISVVSPIIEINKTNENCVYYFEVDTDASFSNTLGLLQKSGEINNSIWQPQNLKDNTKWFLRVQSRIGKTYYSSWTNLSFFVNTTNDAPEKPKLLYPVETIINNYSPLLTIDKSYDIDNDNIVYEFIVYDESGDEVTKGTSSEIEWKVARNLNNNTTYYWSAQTIDEHGLAGGYSDKVWFKIIGDNSLPSAPILLSPLNGSVVKSYYPELKIINALDVDKNILTYHFQIFNNSNLIGSPIAESEWIPENINGYTLWISNTKLENNKTYWWRVKAHDGKAYGSWSTTFEFAINMQNEINSSKKKKICIISKFVSNPEILNKISNFRDKILSRSEEGNYLTNIYYEIFNLHK